ncbi:MAG: hypothetical protein ACFE9D_09840 [Promethearchaeota archaeon]
MVKHIRNRKPKRSHVGIAGLVEPGYGAIYVRTPWMQKLKSLGQNAPKQVKKLHTHHT